MTPPLDVLFVPWPIGAGHTGRCLMAAVMLRDAGLRCAFASDPTGSWAAREGFPVLSESAGQGPARRPRAARPAGGYLGVESLDAAYAGAGYYHPARLRAQVDEDRRILARAQPRLVVTHMQPTVGIAARLAGIPVASIVEADFVPPGAESWMPWIPAGSVQLNPYPPSAPVFRRVLEELGLPPVASTGELLLGDRTLVASTPRLDPVDAELAPGRIAYVGPLLWRPDDTEVAAALARLAPRPGPRVYVTLGSGEVSAVEEVARTALGAAEAGGWSLLLATGYGGHLEIGSPPGHLVLPFGGLGAALEWADALVCHGGHSTVLAGLLAGKPMVIVPALSENEANGRTMVEATGAGFLLAWTEPDRETRRLRVCPRSPELPGLPLTPERLARAVGELLSDGSYSDAARRQSADLQAWIERGPDRLLAPLAELLA